MPKLLPIQLGKMLYRVTNDIPANQLDSAVSLFLAFVQEQQMVSKLPYIIHEYQQYAKEVEGTQDITITSSTPLSKTVLQAITKSMNASEKTVVNTHIDESIIGGVVVQQGNNIFDASIKAQLDRMARTLN